MNTRTLETNAFKFDIPHYYNQKDYNSMRTFIDALIKDTFDSSLGIQLILTDLFRPASKIEFLEWVYRNYPDYKAWLILEGFLVE